MVFWKVYEIASLWMLSWWNDILIKCQVDEMASWCNAKLMKWQVDKWADEIASW